VERLGLDLMSAFGLPPVDYVNLAADLGCGHVTTGLAPLPWNPCEFPAWSLRDDRELRRGLMAALRARNVIVSVVAGFSLKRNADVRDLAADVDLAAELGARQIATVGMDPDIPRSHDQLATLTEMAAGRGLQVVLDYAPHQQINTLAGACAALRHTGSRNALLSLDAMHFFRAGGTIVELVELDPALIGYAQLCDVPTLAPHDDYGREASFERLVPGDGELPLAEFVAALPRAVRLGVEAPNRAAVLADGLAGFLRRAVGASRALIERSEATPAQA
jgi:sugar phosphate isomerase/epimerase